MLDFRSCRYWILGALRRECAKRVVELILPAVGSVGTLAGWHSRCWAAEALNDYSAGCLFQPVVRYYLDLRSRDGVNVRFGEQYASSHFVPSLGPLAKDGVCWASWASCLFAAWSISSGLASFNNASDVTFKVCLRGVYSDCVVVCKFSVFVANALKSRFGSFEPSGTLLALLSANVIDSDERRLYAVGDIRQLKLAWFYSSICDALGKRCGERTLLELAKLGVIKMC